MAKKTTSRTAPATKSPMKTGRGQQPAWVRVTIIVVAVAFIAISVPVVLLGAGGGGGGTNTTAAADAGLERIKAAQRVVDAQPDNMDAAVALGHAYYEYAVVLYQAGQQPGSVPYWLNAVIEYDKALASDPTDEVLLGNKAFALYYAGSSSVGPALIAFIENPSSARLAEQVETARQMLAEVQAQAPSGSLEVTTAP